MNIILYSEKFDQFVVLEIRPEDSGVLVHTTEELNLILLENNLRGEGMIYLADWIFLGAE